MTDKLLPCPFCGGEAEIYEAVYLAYFDGEDGTMSHAFCSTCGAKSRTSQDVKEVFSLWNTRHTPEVDAIKVENERLREITKYASAVMHLLKNHGANIVPHLMDSDENVGQRLRDLLKTVEAD